MEHLLNNKTVSNIILNNLNDRMIIWSYMYPFLAAKTQLKTCTFLLSVCPSVHGQNWFLPIWSPFPAFLCSWQLKVLMTACPWQLIWHLLMTADDSLNMASNYSRWQLAHDRWYDSWWQLAYGRSAWKLMIACPWQLIWQLMTACFW